MIFYGTTQFLSPWSDSKLMVDGVKEMNRTKIQYLTHSWSPIAMKCTPISEGCANCWHLAMAKRLAKNPIIDPFLQGAYAGLRPPILNEKELEAPLHLKKPARIGVQFMGDLFHESVNPEFVKEIFHVMHKSFAGDTFFVLTKRPKRMASWFNWIGRNWSPWPIPNLWLGVSVEDQKTADERIPILLQIPAAKRWISYEPGLGPVDFSGWLFIDEKGDVIEPPINWIVCGGLSLPSGKVKPPQKEWVDSIVEQCDSAGIPLFIKLNAQYPMSDGKEWRQIP